MAKPAKRKFAPGDVATNRQARFRYHLLDSFEAGVVLTGTEVKSLRDGQAQLKDAYVTIRDGEAWLVGSYIAPYPAAARGNHLPEHDRKLLLHRNEIERILEATREKGHTVVPTRIYFAGEGGRSRAKVEIAIAKGKDMWDKRESIKARDTAREVAREIRDYSR